MYNQQERWYVNVYLMNDASEFFLNEISYSFALNFIGILNVLSNYDTGLKSNIQYEL